MKKSILLGGLFLISGVAAIAAFGVQSSAGPAAEVPPAAAATSQAGQTLTLSVPGMHCEFACAPKVRETLAAVPGVNTVETDVETKTATVVVGEGFKLDVAVAKLEKAGYPATVK